MTTRSSLNERAEQPTPEATKRGCLFYVGRAAVLLLLLPLVVIVAGFTFETLMEADDAERYPPPGQLVEVDGYAMHINCVGEGSPAVILESGSGGFSVQHSALQSQLRSDTRVCTYDRAGMGWSEPRPDARTAWQIAHELHTLLGNAGIEPPYILVGPSLGGLFVRAFAAEYPGETAGLVLLDPTHEADLAASQNIPAGLYSFFGRIGTFRLFSGAMCPACTPEGAAAMGASRGHASPWETQAAEWQALQMPEEITIMTERLGETGALGDTLLVVIAANQSGVPLEQAEAEYRAGVVAEKNAMTVLSSNTRYTIVMSDHGLSNQSELILASIRDVLMSARTGKPMAH
jgi:pimeloyl-ACP methyl ester carboxylesterase